MYRLLHVKFQKVEDGNVWHPEVELYQVTYLWPASPVFGGVNTTQYIWK